MNLMNRWVAASAVTALLCACGGSSTPVDTPLIRTTSYGAVAGTDDATRNGTYSWKGIPFAKPPVGALRWKAPVEPDAWSGQLATPTFGNEIGRAHV